MKKLIISSMIGLVFIVLGMMTGPQELTADGFSLKWFFYLMGGLFVFLPIAIVLFFSLKRRQNLALIKNGLAGKAKIIAATTTGTEINLMPVFQFELEVTLPGKTPYTMQHRCIVNLAHITKAAKGSEVSIVVHPNNSKKILIRWDQ